MTNTIEELRFGFLNEKLTLDSQFFSIQTLKNIDNDYKNIINSFWVENDWIYPPIEFHNKRPTKIQIRYTLPNSHILKLKKNQNEFFYNFVILVLSFFYGTYLRQEKWGYFYRTPICKNKLVSFRISNKSDLASLLEESFIFFQNVNGSIRKLIYSTIHWFLIGQSYIHGFEKFDAQYRVLDCCYNLFLKLNNKKKTRHSQWCETLCEFYSLPLSEWAKRDPKGNCKLSNFRNSFIHKATYNNEAIGLKVDKFNYEFWLTKFNERLILLIMGIKSDNILKPLHKSTYRIDNFSHYRRHLNE